VSVWCSGVNQGAKKGLEKLLVLLWECEPKLLVEKNILLFVIELIFVVVVFIKKKKKMLSISSIK
jgi:hypothetical protein